MPQGEAAKHVLLAYQEEGMDPFSILRSSTYLSAKFMGKEEELGVLKKGALADLIAVKGDVQNDFAKAIFDLVLVMKNGKVFVDTEGFVKELVVAEEILDNYAGDYKLNPDLIITVSNDGSQLKAKATNQGEYLFYPKSEKVFYAKDVNLQLTFNVGEDGQIESLTLLAGGGESIAPRIK